MAISGYSISTGVAATIGIVTSALAYSGAYSIQQIGTNNWNYSDAILSSIKGMWKGALSFGLGFFGGRIGIMNTLDNYISNSFYTKIEMTPLRFITFTAQSLIGEGKTKMAYSMIVALLRWIL